MRFLSAGNQARAALPLPGAETALRATLEGHIRTLAEDIGERHLGRPRALEQAAEYLGAQLAAAGLSVTAEPFPVAGHTCRNLIADLGPPGPRLLVGAHYDTVPGSPGADDNASGAAALLALAADWAGREAPPPVRLAAFVNEEPPYFQSPAMGSRVHAHACRRAGTALTGALALDGLGFYSDRPGSQTYPVAQEPELPDRGDFVALVANEGSAGLLEALVAAYPADGLPVQGAVLPEAAPGTGWSDHWAFWQEGWPGVMATDTLPFRNPHYHAPSDTPDTLDLDRLTRAVSGLAAAVPRVAMAGT